MGTKYFWYAYSQCPLEEAERTYGEEELKRAFTYKALNKLIQGSCC
jgi:hypothetical protein